MVEVRWTPQSIEDIENIAEYIAKNSIKFANIQVTDFFDEAIVLKKFPKLGRIVPEVGDKNIRELFVGLYRLIYLIIDENRIDIITVYHANRLLNPEVIKKRI